MAYEDQSNRKFTWRKATLAEVLRWYTGKSVAVPEYVTYTPPCRGGAYGLILSDGSAVVAASDWSGPYSEVTPDVDADPPEFFIGTPAQEA